MTPEGNFTLQADQTNKRKFVGFAAGSGITPIMSMIKQLKMMRLNHHLLYSTVTKQIMMSFLKTR